ncbi:hypothetical protein [Actinopolyspora halophila]|uniref:hypothetical protein n=1 Tax=Actinopolyspora halophila TaxID=1850 RepID=UPI0003A533F6|nr:hypothetical protein [Actinopolyspora halophila]
MHERSGRAGEDPAARHSPRMSAAEVERVRGWHERAYRAALAEGADERTFSYLGRTIGVPPSVQPINRTSRLHGLVCSGGSEGEPQSGSRCGILDIE